MFTKLDGHLSRMLWGGGCTSALGKRLGNLIPKRTSSLNVLFAAFLAEQPFRKKKACANGLCIVFFLLMKHL